MLLDDLPFRCVERPRLLENAVRQRDLPDVVHGRRVEKQIQRVLLPAELARNRDCVVGHAQDVLARLIVLVFCCETQPTYGVDGACA